MNNLTGTISENLNLYDGCPPICLNYQTIWGEKMHRIVEDIFEQDLDTVPSYVDPCSLEWVSANRVCQLKYKQVIKSTSVEESIKWAGGSTGEWTIRADIIGTVLGNTAIIDIKATKNLNMKAARAQLSAYAYALMQRDNISTPLLYVLHLPMNGLGKLKRVPIMDYKELLDFLQNNQVEGVECWEGSNWIPSSDHKIW